MPSRYRRTAKILWPVLLTALVPANVSGQRQPASTSLDAATRAVTSFPTILYGAAYYHEYEPTYGNPAAHDARLEEDIRLMKASGLTVVRMGESTWSLWEPEDGRFEYAWMDRVVAAMQQAGIKVILGTPTYSIPTWMARAHPEIFAIGPDGRASTYGIRQNMDTDSPAFRFYAQRLIRNLVEHYRDNPAVIGWQIDNETGSYNASNPDVQIGFVNYLKQKFGTTDALNKAWLLNYWGETINSWENVPIRQGATSTAYKLEWTRWQQHRVTDYLSWQAALVRASRRPDQFITQDFSNHLHEDVNETDVACALDVVALNPYIRTQNHMDGAETAEMGDYYRSLKHQNYLVTETNAQTTDWTSSYQFPPFDGQLRLNVYANLSSGANMVEYWHWHSIHSGQETYWKGLLSHDMEPNRILAEFSRTAHELARLGPDLVNLKPQNDVAILYSVDSSNALNVMPFADRSGQWSFGKPDVDYLSLVQQLHRSLYQLNVGTDFVTPETTDLSGYKLLIVPALYIADDALLTRIADFVRNGGHVLMTFKSGFADENSMVRQVRAPGPLREAAGLSYQEFSNLEQPLALKPASPDAAPLFVPASAPEAAGGAFASSIVKQPNTANYWAEFLLPEHAQPLALYDHPFFGRWPAITENTFGKGTLLYEGTWLSDDLQRAMLLRALDTSAIPHPASTLPASVRAKSGTNGKGRPLHYLLNFSSAPATFPSPFTGTDLLTGRSITTGAQLTLAPWDLAIVAE